MRGCVNDHATSPNMELKEGEIFPSYKGKNVHLHDRGKITYILGT